MRDSIRVVLLIAVLVFATTGSAFAEGAKSSFTSDVLTNLERTGEKLLALAEATPEDKFSWRPNDEVRTLSEVYMHVVGTNILLPVAMGAAPPKGLDMPENPFALMSEWEAKVTTKKEVVAKLRESLEYAAEAIGSIEDLETEVDIFGPPSSKRAWILVVLTHAHEHLGQAIAYTRSLGIAPPWSRSDS